MNRWNSLVFVLVTPFFFLGCNLENASNDQNRGGSMHPKSQKRVVSLESDCGVMYPGMSKTEKFKVSNDSDVCWTVGKVGVTCVCTVADISSKDIEPGETAIITVNYRAPEVECDERRRVVVHFENPLAPIVELVIVAKVRKKVSVLPTKLVFDEFEGSSSIFEAIAIENHSGEKWRDLSVSNSLPWVKAVVVDASDPTAGYQSFRVEVEINLGKLEPGNNQAELVVNAVTQAGENVEIPIVPINAAVRPNVIVLP
jgi:hypothetical protein